MTQTADDGPDRLLTVRTVLSIVPFSDVHLMRMVRAGTFPAPLKIGASKIAFRESEVRAWIDAAPRATSWTGDGES